MYNSLYPVVPTRKQLREVSDLWKITQSGHLDPASKLMSLPLCLAAPLLNSV